VLYDGCAVEMFRINECIQTKLNDVVIKEKQGSVFVVRNYRKEIDPTVQAAPTQYQAAKSCEKNKE